MQEKTNIWLNKATKREPASLYIYGDVGVSWFSEGVEAKQVADVLKGLAPTDPLDIHINSPGGSVPEGIAILNLLKQHKGTKTVYIDGLAASIASLISMAGDKVVMPKTALFMAHSPWARSVGNAEQLRAAADVLDKWRDAMSNAYAEKTGKTPEEITAAIFDGADHWYSADEALDFGFIDQVESDTPAAMAAFQDVPESMRYHAAAVYYAALPNTQEKNMPNPEETKDPVAAAAPKAEPVVEPTPVVEAKVDAEAAIQARVAEAVAAAQAEAQAKIEAAQAEAVAAKAKLDLEIEARELRDVVAEVQKTYANLPGKADDLAPALRQLRKADPEACAKVEAALAAANAVLNDAKTTGFEPIGSSTADSQLEPEALVQKKAEEIRKQDPSKTIEQARAMVYTQHPELAKAVRGEKD